MEVLIQVLLFFFVTLLIIGVLLVVFIIGRVSVIDNPYKAFIYIKTGSHISKPKKANHLEVTSKGITYIYGSKTITVPNKYQEVYHRGRRVVYVTSTGQLVSSPFDDDSPLSAAEKEDLIYDFIEANTGRNAIAAIKSRIKTKSIIIVAVVAFVIGAVIVFAYTQFQANQQARLAPAQQQQQTEIPKIEVLP